MTVLSHTRTRFHPRTGRQSRIVLSPLPRLMIIIRIHINRIHTNMVCSIFLIHTTERHVVVVVDTQLDVPMSSLIQKAKQGIRSTRLSRSPASSSAKSPVPYVPPDVPQFNSKKKGQVVASEQSMAATIQAQWRGNVVRRGQLVLDNTKNALGNTKNILTSQTSMVTKAATQVQASWRGRMERTSKYVSDKVVGEPVEQMATQMRERMASLLYPSEPASAQADKLSRLEDALGKSAHPVRMRMAAIHACVMHAHGVIRCMRMVVIRCMRMGTL